MGKQFSNNICNKYTHWIEWTPKCLATSSPFIFPILIITFLYFLGFFISYYNNFYILYISSRSIYICLFGIFYAFTFGKIHGKYFKKLIPKLRPLLDTSDIEFNEFIDKWLSILCDNKKHIIYSIIITVTATVFGNIFWKDALTNKYLRFMWFMEAEWYQSPLFPKLLILNIFGIFVFFLMTSGVRSFFIFIGLSRELTKYKISVSPKLASFFFKKLNDFNLVTFFHWSIGITLVIISFYQFKNINFVSVMIAIFLTISGSIMIIIPKLYYQKMIANKRESLINQLLIFDMKNIEGSFSSLKEFKNFSILNKASDEVYYSNLRTSDFSNILKFIGFFLPIITIILRIMKII